jgi:hypothetical protein
MATWSGAGGTQWGLAGTYCRSGQVRALSIGFVFFKRATADLEYRSVFNQNAALLDKRCWRTDLACFDAGIRWTRSHHARLGNSHDKDDRCKDRSDDGTSLEPPLEFVLVSQEQEYVALQHHDTSPSHALDHLEGNISRNK